MADAEGSYSDEEGSYTQSYSQDGDEYYSDGEGQSYYDEDYAEGEEASWDSRQREREAREGDQHGEDVNDASQSYYSEQSHSLSQSSHDEDQSQRSHSQSQSYYDEEGSYYDDGEGVDEGSYYSEDRTPSNSQSYYSEGDQSQSHSYYSDDEPLSHSNYDEEADHSYSDRTPSQSASYDEERSYSDRTPSHSGSGRDGSGSFGYDENSDNRSKRQIPAPSSPVKAYGFSEPAFPEDTNSMGSSTPSFAFDLQNSAARASVPDEKSGSRDEAGFDNTFVDGGGDFGDNDAAFGFSTGEEIDAGGEGSASGRRSDHEDELDEEASYYSDEEAGSDEQSLSYYSDEESYDEEYDEDGSYSIDEEYGSDNDGQTEAAGPKGSDGLGPQEGIEDVDSSGRSRSSSEQSISVDSYDSENSRSRVSRTRSVGSRSGASRSLRDRDSSNHTARGGYSRDQMTRLVEQHLDFEDNPDDNQHRKLNGKSEELLELVANVNDAMLELEEHGDRSDYAEKKESDEDDLGTVARRLLHGFEGLVGILLQFSDELEVMSVFVHKKDAAAIEALESLLDFAPIINDMFVQLKPILMDCLEEEMDDEMTDFLYGMNLLVELLCELSHVIGEKQEWNPRANTAFATLLELLSRDTLEVTCIYDDVDTPDYEPTETIEEAWAGTGHEEEYKSLQAANELDMFRQVCYDVLLSTDQWCPDTKTLMDVCGIDDTLLEQNHPFATEEDLVEVPEAAVQVLEKINGEPLPRASIMARILRRVLPTDALTDKSLMEKITQIKSANRNSLGLPSSNLIAISSVPEVLDDPEALGVAGVGKSTLAAMVASHADVRRFFNDGVAWVHIGRQEITYPRYVQYLREIVVQLDVPEDEEPLFPELLHIPGESKAQRRRREEGFMLYIRDIMVDFLQFRNVLIVIDNICSDGDLDWFDFDPAELLPDDAEEENTCVILVTTRIRSLLPAADTVEVDMLEEEEAVDLLIKESGDLSKSLVPDAPVTRSVVQECANHPLAVKSVGRWLNLKHATAGAGNNSPDALQDDVILSMEKILKRGNQDDTDMMYEILNMSLSPAINGEPTNIIKFCFAAFVLVFCCEKHLSDFSVADATPVVPLTITEALIESLLDLEEETLLKEGSLFHAQKKDAAVLIPEALSALGVMKGVISVVEPAEDDDSDAKEIEEKYVQVMHAIQEEYGEYLYQQDAALVELTKDGEQTWNKAFATKYLSTDHDWGTDTPDAGLDYALEMIPSHMVRGCMFKEAANLLTDSNFVRGRLFALGRENGTRRHIKDCELLFDATMEKRSSGRRVLDSKSFLKQSYQVLGGLLNMDEDEYIAEAGSPEALEVARSHFEIGFSLAEKRCWEAAIAHWETSQELLVSSLGMVEVVAGIQFNVGVVYAEMNEYEQALGSLKQCLRIRGAIHGEQHILYAQTIQKIGDVFLAMSDYHEAMESYNWALDVMHNEATHHRIDIGDILQSMGDIHYCKGEIEEALQCFQDALRSKQMDLGEDHPELSSTYHHIGNCLSDQGKIEEAIAHLEEAIRLKLMDPDGGGERDADILTIQGVLQNLNGHQQEGLECYEKALQILVTKVPHKKEKVASLLHLIGCVYLMSGEHKKAMKLFEESLHARRKVLGFVHLDVASTLFNMAFLHQMRNRPDKALKCLEEALKIRQLRLPDSEKVAITHEKIGTLARSIGKTKKAEIAFGEALRIRKLIHGDKHEAVATVLQELGDLMDDLGEYDDAMKYYVEALGIREKELGPDDVAVAETLYSMGFSLQNNDNPERALECFEESLSIRQFQLGEDAKEVGDTLNIMGFLMAQTGELEEALALLWDALRIRKLREDHIKVSETLKNIGNVHREKREYELAIECYEECLRIRRAELGDDHEKVADALIAMGNAQGDLGSNNDAMRSYEGALRIRTMVFGEQDESVAAVLQYMGTLEFRAERLDRALQLLNEYIRIREEVGAENDGEFVSVLFMVGNIYKMQKNEEEAKRVFTEAYKIFMDLGLAEENPEIAQNLSSVVDDPELKQREQALQESATQTPEMRSSHGNAAPNVNVRKILGRLKNKVLDTANAATKRGKDKGQQL